MIAIIKSTIMNCIRDRKNLIFMIFFPLFLVILIGSTTSNFFDQETSTLAIEGLDIYYIDEGNEETKEVFNAFSDVIKESKDIEDTEIKEIESLNEGKEQVRVNRAILLHLKDNNIEIYSNNNSSIKSSIIYQILESVSDRYNAITEVYTINPVKAEEIVNNNSYNFIEEENIPYESTPTSMDYYGVAEIGLMLFYFISYPMFNLKEDKRNNIKDRIKLSGIPTSKYYIASFIGFFIFSYGVSLISYILSNIMFDINYGDNLLIMPLAMIPFLIIINSIGTILPIIINNNKVAETTIQSIIIPVLTFLGGGYIAIYGESKGIFNLLTKISPLKWFNNSVFRYIYSKDSSLLVGWLIFGGIALLATIILLFLISKREDRGNEKFISVN